MIKNFIRSKKKKLILFTQKQNNFFILLHPFLSLSPTLLQKFKKALINYKYTHKIYYYKNYYLLNIQDLKFTSENFYKIIFLTYLCQFWGYNPLFFFFNCKILRWQTLMQWVIFYKKKLKKISRLPMLISQTITPPFLINFKKFYLLNLWIRQHYAESKKN